MRQELQPRPGERADCREDLRLRRRPGQAALASAISDHKVASATTSSSMSASLWTGEGVSRIRSVPRGTERIRLTPSPVHSDADMDELVVALATLWSEMALAKAA